MISWRTSIASFGRHERTRLEDHETSFADELLAKHTEAEVRDLIDYTIAGGQADQLAEMLYLGHASALWYEWSAAAARRKERERRDAAVTACPYCTKDGCSELKEQGTGRLLMHVCPHRLEFIAKIEDGLKAYRI